MSSPVKSYSNKSFMISSPPYNAFGSKVSNTISYSIYTHFNVTKFVLKRVTSLNQCSTSNQMYLSAQSTPYTQSCLQNAQNVSAAIPQSNIVLQSPMPSTEPHDAINSIKIQNCVATVNLGCDLNLRKINFRTRNSEYNPSRFHGVIMRIREPRCTALIFRSGKLVCTGARNEVSIVL